MTIANDPYGDKFVQPADGVFIDGVPLEELVDENDEDKDEG